MSSFQKNSSKQKLKSDRCANPYELDGHKGTDLRNMTQEMLGTFQNVALPTKIICQRCRNKYYQNKTVQAKCSTDNRTSNLSEESCDSDSEPPPAKKSVCLEKKN